MSGYNLSAHIIYHRFRIRYNLSCFLRFRCMEQCNIIFRHHDLCCSHIIKVLFLTQQPIIFCRITNLSTTAHYKPHLPDTLKMCFSDPIPHKPWNSPCICRCNDNKTVIHLYSSCVTSLNLIVCINQFITNIICDPLRNVTTVSCSRKVYNHILHLLQFQFCAINIYKNGTI